MIGSIVKYPKIMYKPAGVMGSRLISYENTAKVGMIVNVKIHRGNTLFRVMCCDGSIKMSKGEDFKFLIKNIL
jgi:hypothetical protein